MTSSNLGIYAANKLGDNRYSINEIAAIMGITKQGVHLRVKQGAQVYERLEVARAAGTPAVRLADVREARALVLGQAGISPRELEAGPADG